MLDDLKSELQIIAKSTLDMDTDELISRMNRSGYIEEDIQYVMSLRGALKKESPKPKNRARQRAARALAKETGVNYTTALRMIDQEEAEKKDQS